MSMSIKKVITQNSLVIVLIIISVLICMFWGFRKADFFMDEIYSFGLSNSYYAPFLSDITGGNLVGNTLSGREISEYLSVGNNDRFAVGSVIYNQSCDVHPPFFYVLLNAFSSFFAGNHSKWIGLLPNIIYYAATLLLLYLLTIVIFKEIKYGIIAVLLYGFEKGAFSSVMMIRMYMLKALLTTALAFVTMLFFQKNLNDRKWNERIILAIAVFLIVFLGLSTQYFFVFYAFFISVFAFFMLIRKYYSNAVVFSLSSLGGAASFIVFYQTYLHNINNQDVQNRIKDNAIAVSQYFKKVMWFTVHSAEEYPLAFILSFIILFCLLIMKAKIKGFRIEETDSFVLIICIPAIISFLFISVSVYYWDLRYIYSLMPVLMLLPVWAFSLYERNVSHIYLKPLYILIIIAITIIIGLIREPAWVYSDHTGKYNGLAGKGKIPCVYYLTDNNPAVPSVTQDLFQLVSFDTIYFVNSDTSNSIDEYLKQYESDKYVLYIMDFYNKLDREGIAEKIVKTTGYDKYEFLYERDSSAVFLISNS